MDKYGKPAQAAVPSHKLNPKVLTRAREDLFKTWDVCLWRQKTMNSQFGRWREAPEMDSVHITSEQMQTKACLSCSLFFLNSLNFGAKKNVSPW